MNKMTANISIAAGVALALCKKEEGSMSSLQIKDLSRKPLHRYTYDIYKKRGELPILRLIRMHIGQNIRLDSSWAKNPVFETPQEAYDAGMALGDFRYYSIFNNFDALDNAPIPAGASRPGGGKLMRIP